MNGNPVGAEPGASPEAVRLHENFPNPFRDATLLPFSLGAPDAVEVVVYDVLGRRVRRLAERDYPAGHHGVAWDGRDGSGQPVPAGVYVAQLRAGDVVRTRKLLVVR